LARIFLPARRGSPAPGAREGKRSAATAGPAALREKLPPRAQRQSRGPGRAPTFQPQGLLHAQVNSQSLNANRQVAAVIPPDYRNDKAQTGSFGTFEKEGCPCCNSEWSVSETDKQLQPQQTMNRFRTFKSRLRAGAGLALLATGVYWASLALVAGPETKAPDSKDKPSDTKQSKPEKKAAKVKLTGAELYAINCNRCHPERYATEWNSSQWKTLMLHMRVRANLPAAQAKQILRYLQEDSGN
jgi:hypothetical protein